MSIQRYSMKISGQLLCIDIYKQIKQTENKLSEMK